mgnify:CR=1 FL=1
MTQSGIGKVFRFTLKQHLSAKGYRTATVLVMLLCFLLPAGIMWLCAATADGSADGAGYVSRVKQVFVVDESATAAVDWQCLDALPSETVASVTYTNAASLETARELANATADSLLLVVRQDESGYALNVLLPDTTALTWEDADAFAAFAESGFPMILAQKSGLSYAQLGELATPLQTAVVTGGVSAEDDGLEMVKWMFSFILPFVNLMLLYFLVLFYGQSVANNVMMEKTSKLMDTFLVAVKPRGLIFGKVLAIVLTGIVQFSLWVGALIGGFAAGTALVKAVDPATDMALVRFFDSIGQLSGVFSVPGAIVAVLIVAAGLLLYSSLSAVGGAVAGKPEDLSTTNVLFTAVLLISFFATFFGSGLTTGEPAFAAWMNWFPFTAVLVTPSQLLLGDLPIAAGIGSLAVILLTAAAVMLLAGRIYRMLALYKGSLPSPSKLVEMLRGK